MRYWVYQTAYLLGLSAMPAWVAACEDHNKLVKLVAIDAVRSVGPPSPEKTRALIKLLQDPDREVRGHAIIALDRMGPFRQDAVPALIDVLSDNYSGPRFAVAGNVREVAAWTLGRIGPEAAAAVPELTKLLADPYVRMRQEAAAALAHIQREQNVPPGDMSRSISGVLDSIDPKADKTTKVEKP